MLNGSDLRFGALLAATAVLAVLITSSSAQGELDGGGGPHPVHGGDAS